MDISGFLTPAVVFLFIYLIIELFVHRKERLQIIEKIDKMNSVDLSKINLTGLGNFTSNLKKYKPLRTGLLLIGIGLGVLIGYLLCIGFGLYHEGVGYQSYQTSVIYLSCTVLFGGLGLLIAYLVEKKENKK